MASKDDNVELRQGAIDLIGRRPPDTMGPLHACALQTRLPQELWLEN